MPESPPNIPPVEAAGAPKPPKAAGAACPKPIAGAGVDCPKPPRLPKPPPPKPPNPVVGCCPNAGAAPKAGVAAGPPNIDPAAGWVVDWPKEKAVGAARAVVPNGEACNCPNGD